MASAAVGFAGSFAVCSYIADIGRQVAGVSASYIPVLLAIAGLGMTIGNAVGGVATDRSLNGTLLIGFPLYIVALTTMIFVVTSPIGLTDRKSTRLNSSHVAISYAVFCLKKKK